MGRDHVQGSRGLDGRACLTLAAGLSNLRVMPIRRRPKPQQAMLDHITGYWVSQMIFVAAKLGIADVIAKGPKTPRPSPSR